MMRNNGTTGLIFRSTDPYNYYALFLIKSDNCNSFSGKRFVKVINGKHQILS